MTEFAFPERYLVIRYRCGPEVRGCYVVASELERLEHEWEQHLTGGPDRLVTVQRISGEILHVRISDLLLLAEQTQVTLGNDFAIEAAVIQLERDTKRAILGTDYDPEWD